MRKLLAATLAGAVVVTGGMAASARQGVADPTSKDPSTERRTYAVGGFDRVGQAGPNRVLVTVGPATSVRAEGPHQTLELYEVVVEHGSLSIRPKRDRHWNERDWQRHDIAPATFYVTLPRISGASTAGSGDIRVDRVAGGHFAASVAGSGKVEIASLAVDNAEFSIAGSGDLLARGSARQARVSIAGTGDVKTRDVTSDDASISIVGSGNAALTVRHAAQVSIMGSGDVDIAGPARCTVSHVGGGSVRCGNLAQASGD